MKAEVIKLSENAVEIDGVKYLRQEPEFKVGQWRKFQDKLFRVKEVGKDYFEYDNSYISGYPMAQRGSGMWKESILATKDEIESHLIKVADEKQYKCKTVISLNSGEKRIPISFSEYDMASDTLYFRDKEAGLCASIYRQGKWAEILPSKKKLPVTKEGISMLIEMYHNQNDGLPFKTPIDEFMSQYE